MLTVKAEWGGNTGECSQLFLCFSLGSVMTEFKNVPNCFSVSLREVWWQSWRMFPTVSLFQFGKCDDRVQECSQLFLCFSSESVMTEFKNVPNCFSVLVREVWWQSLRMFPTFSLFQFGKCDDRVQECPYGGEFPSCQPPPWVVCPFKNGSKYYLHSLLKS